MNDMTLKNYPISLSCGHNLCLNCHTNMINKNTKCPFNETHEHISDPIIRNMALLDMIEEFMKNNKSNINSVNMKIKEKNIIPDNDKFIYKGTLKDNKPFGKGKLIYEGIGIFEGEFNGEYHKGKGEIIYNDGSSYKGEWENFKRQNYGVLEFPNFDKYEGEFKDDLFEGKGKLILFERNLIYEGFWRNGKKFGKFNIYNEFEEFIKTENYENDIKIN